MKNAAPRTDLPGFVALAVDRGGVIAHEASGVEPDAIFRIHSMTKPITSVAAMMLVDEQRLALDDEVAAYLPAYAAPEVITESFPDGSVRTRPARTRMTVRHLLTNTGGFGYAFSNPTLAALAAREKKPEWDLPLLHDPGAKWTYGVGTKLLGDIVEQIAGEPLEMFVRRRIFDPLGMHDTFYDVPAAKQPRLARNYTREGGRVVEAPAEPPRRAPGATGLHSTAEDYGRFMRLILNRGRHEQVQLVSEDSVAAMGRNAIGELRIEEQPAADQSRTRPFPAGVGRDTFGLGFQIAAEGTPGGRAAGSLSWSGLRNTHFWIDPASGVGGVLMMQLLPFYDAAAMALFEEFERQVYRAA